MTRTPTFTPQESAALENLPHSELVDLAVELDLVVPARIERMSLLGDVVVALAERARTEGLPLSPYDREDLEALPAQDRAALARLIGQTDNVDAILKACQKVTKRYRSERPRSAVALMLPSLIAPLARWAAGG